MAKSLKACGIKPTQENANMFQALHLTEKDMLDGTCNEIDKRIREIFSKYEKEKSIKNLYFNLKEMLSSYKGSPLAESLLNKVETLEYNNVKDIKEWSKNVDTREYRKKQSEIQELLDKCSSKKISLDELKTKMLANMVSTYTPKKNKTKPKKFSFKVQCPM